jgi:phospholipase/carboxylesterase
VGRQAAGRGPGVSASSSAGEDLGFAHALERGTGSDTLLVLHATGGDEHQLLPLARQLAPDATLLAPRGKVMEGGVTRRFFARRGMLDLDLDDLRHASDELAAFVTAATQAYGLDPSRVTALGYSNGANVAVGMLFRHPQVLAGAALLRPLMPYEPESMPALTGRRVLINAATQDPYAPPAVTERLAAILRDGGADVTTSTVQGGHDLQQADIVAAGEWLAAMPGA